MKRVHGSTVQVGHMILSQLDSAALFQWDGKLIVITSNRK